MTIVATSKPEFSKLFKGMSHYDFENMVNTHYETVGMTGSGDIQSWGIPVIWDDATTSFVRYVAQDIPTAIATGTSPLPKGQVAGILVGDAFGKGFINDVTLSGTATNVTALYNGHYTLSDEGMDWSTSTQGQIDLFKAELAQHDIGFIVIADDIDPSYTA